MSIGSLGPGSDVAAAPKITRRQAAVFGSVLLALGVVLFFAYRHSAVKDYSWIHVGTSEDEIIARLGQPDLKTTQMDIDMWFYGLQNVQEHSGTYNGLKQYSFNAECALIFGSVGRDVIGIDRSPGKQWVVSLQEAPRPAGR